MKVAILLPISNAGKFLVLHAFLAALARSVASACVGMRELYVLPVVTSEYAATINFVLTDIFTRYYRVTY